MNKICKKTKLVLLALLAVIMAFCGVISLAPTIVYAEGAAKANVSALTEDSIDLSDAKWMIGDVEFDGNPLSYDGRSKQFTLGGFDLVYEYYGADDTKLDAAPKFAGSYYVKAVAPEGTVLTGEYEERKDFIIEKATLINPSVSFTEELDIVRGKWIVKATPSTSNFYSDAVITGTLEAGLAGTYQIKLEFTLTDENFRFDASQPQNTRYSYEILDNGEKFVITYEWTIKENVERSFTNAQNMTVIVDENNTLPEGIAETNFKVSMDEFSLEDYTDTFKEEFSDKGVRFGAAYNIYFVENENNAIEVADGSKFLITVPVPDTLNDYEKDNIKVMFVKPDGDVEFISINDFVDETWGEDESKVTVKSIDFETVKLGTFVIIGLKQLPDSVGSWWQIALIVALAIVVVLVIVFFVMKSKKGGKPNKGSGEPVKDETEDSENKNE